MENQLKEKYSPYTKKRERQSDDNVGEMVLPQSLQNSWLAEPSPPLGLHLNITPPLIDLVQTRLSQQNPTSSSYTTNNLGCEVDKKKDLKSTDKFKASNFSACLLKIGSWEWKSRYEGDLVAKCYYAKHKLIWEILDGVLKKKIEIQWSDITAIKATYSHDMETLDIVLAREPLFFREVNPQPRKHTMWQTTTDFTNGQASKHRRHCLRFPPSKLKKHFENLIKCDPRLKSLSLHSEIDPKSPYFDPKFSTFQDRNESNKPHGCENLEGCFNSNLHVLQQGNVLASTAPSTSYSNELSAPIAATPDISQMGFFSLGSDLIQTSLSQQNSTLSLHTTSNLGHEAGKKKDLKSTAISGTVDKLNASIATNFINGQANIHRRNSLRCPPGKSKKNFEKLIQYDPHMKSLSQHFEMKPLYFYPWSFVSENHDESNRHNRCEDLEGDFNSNLHVLQQNNVLASTTPSSTYNNNEINAHIATTTHCTEINSEISNGPNRGDQVEIHCINSSISVSELMNHLREDCISDDSLLEIDCYDNIFTIEDVERMLLSESPPRLASCERSLMSNVDSIHGLIQPVNLVDDVDDPYADKFTLKEVQQSIRNESLHDLASDHEHPFMSDVDPCYAREGSNDELPMNLLWETPPPCLHTIFGDSENPSN